ncbi:Crp/Fnr family transcriptional regulator [Puteibacter caeruleilacunae]|nr:Crp/Fnr family transcriptional regulator [Puteibacter caeruleilacunae]
MTNNSLSINNKLFREFKDLFVQHHVPSKVLLLREGQISNKLYLIEEGCVRLWFNNNGKDVTFQFFFEGEGVSSIESFRLNQPSLFNIETIEPSVIWELSKANFLKIQDKSSRMRAQLEEITFQRLITYQKLFLSRIKENPQERYEQLLLHNPEIIKRVPQHYIASYLGISPVSLSRIRNRK